MTHRDGSVTADIVATARRTIELGLNHGATGNVSARTRDGCLITPSAIPFETLTADQVVAIDLHGAPRNGGGVPSSEWRFHTSIYAERPEAGAVIHCHPTHATAISCLREAIPAFHYLVPMLGGTDIRCSGYATFGTPELAEAMLAALEGRKACLLANHGIVAYGADLDDALNMAVTVEVLAHQYTVARTLGTPVRLGQDEVAELLRRFATYGQPVPPIHS